MFFSGYNMWLNKLNYGTLTGRITQPFPNTRFLNEDNRLITNTDLRDHLVVLDFWNRGCGVCFRKFPVLQEKYCKYLPDKHIEIYAVNIPVRNDRADAGFQLIRRKNYTFPVMILQDTSLLRKLQIRAVPVVLIVKNGSEIIFKGEIEDIDSFLSDK